MLSDTSYQPVATSPRTESYPVDSGKMSTHRSFVLLAVFTSFLAICCVGLVGVIIWREYYRDTKTDETPMTNITIMQQKFPGYFRTPEEQAEFEREMNFAPVVVQVRNTSSVHTRCFYNGYCEKNIYNGNSTTIPPYGQTGPNQYARRRRRRQVNPSSYCLLDKLSEKELTYHGCCISYTEFIDPDTLPTAEPNQSGMVEVAQFSFLKQYFTIQECCQARDCTGCQCSQTYYVVSAVVKRGGNYVVEYVRVPGCCQCLNSDIPTPS